MRIFTWSSLIILLISIALSGCIIQSRQLNGVLELMKNPPMDLSEESWLVRYLDYESVIYAVSTSQGILFSNNFGDQILFDGWTLREVSGMGSRQIKMSISDTKNVRTFKRGNRIISNHRCTQWELEQNSGVVRYTQYCSNKRGYTNSILVKQSGDISVIRQIIDERYTALTLTKLK